MRYMLDGSVRKTDTVVRVSAQLIDTETGAQVWSDRVDGNWTASMEVQDVITSQLHAGSISNSPSRKVAEQRICEPAAQTRSISPCGGGRF